MDPRINILSIRLKRALEGSNGALTQVDVAIACGVDQGLVSRILNRKVKRWTLRIEGVSDYVNNRHTAEASKEVCSPLPPEVVAMVEGYLDAGCDIDLLRRQLEILQAARSGR